MITVKKVQAVAQENLQLAIDRGEKLNDLEEKAKNLEDNAHTFEKRSETNKANISMRLLSQYGSHCLSDCGNHHYYSGCCWSFQEEIEKKLLYMY